MKVSDTKPKVTTEIFGDFGKGLQSLLEQAIADKSKELEERERIVTEREAKVNHILKESENSKGCIKLQVGSVVFFTSASTLLKVPDSFFHGLLNPNFRSEKDDVIFIDRDGNVFPYVLEYLTYGELISSIDDVSILKKLEHDAHYYLLLDLQKEVSQRINLQKKVEEIEEKKVHVILKLKSSATATSGSYINWNIATTVPTSHFQHNGSTTITILQTGLYQIFVQYALQCASNGNGNANIDLYVSGNVVARVYHGQSDNYTQSRCLAEILPLQANDTLMVMYRSNANGVADQYANSITILLLQ